MIYESLRDDEKKISCRFFKNIYSNLHFHKSIEIFYVLKGKFSIRIGEHQEQISANEIAFIPSYVAHQITNLGITESITLIIPEIYFNNRYNNGNFYYEYLRDVEKNKEILDVIKKININKDNDTILLQGYIYQLFGIICENYKATISQDKGVDIIKNIIKYIQENYSTNITLDQISNYFGYSKYYFSHIFNKYFGCTLKLYINKIRFDMVNNNTESISTTEKILNAGFNNLSTYYKIKKQIQIETLMYYKNK